MQIEKIKEILNIKQVSYEMLSRGLKHQQMNCFIRFSDYFLAVRLNTGNYFLCDNNPNVLLLLSEHIWFEGLCPYTRINGKIIDFASALYPECHRFVFVNDNFFDIRDCNLIKTIYEKCSQCEFLGTPIMLKTHSKSHENDGLRGSKGERKIIHILQSLGIYFIYDKTYEDLRGKRGFIRFDFRIPISNGHNLFIEVDGEHHRRVVTYGGMEYHKALKAHESTVLHDSVKNKFVIERGDHILRIPDFEINSFQEKVDSFILRNSKLLDKYSKDRLENITELVASGLSMEDKVKILKNVP